MGPQSINYKGASCPIWYKSGQSGQFWAVTDRHPQASDLRICLNRQVRAASSNGFKSPLGHRVKTPISAVYGTLMGHRPPKEAPMPTPEPYATKNLGTRWRVRYRHQGRHPSMSFATEAEAQKFCALLGLFDDPVKAVAAVNPDSESTLPTLDGYAPTHFAALTEANADTVNRYRNIYARDWSPRLGKYRLDHLNRQIVAAALNQIEGSDKTRKNKWAVLTHMLKLAAQDGLITRSPTVGIKLGRRTSHEAVENRYLTHANFQTLLEDTPEHWRPFVMFLAGTGARYGEAAALTVGDIDLETNVVRITKAEKRDPNNPSQRIVGPTKTGKSRRTVSLPDQVVEALKPLLGRPKNARLFLPPKGGPLRHKTFYTDIWLPKCTKRLDPKPRVHDLRHSHVAWLIAAGAPLPVIQARLGHEKITTTIDTYGHLLPDVKTAAAKAAGLVFEPLSAIER